MFEKQHANSSPDFELPIVKIFIAKLLRLFLRNKQMIQSLFSELNI